MQMKMRLNKRAITRIQGVLIIVILVIVAGLGVYYYTLPAPGPGPTTATTVGKGKLVLDWWYESSGRLWKVIHFVP